MTIIDAVYKNGVFQPTERVELPDDCRVRLKIESLEDAARPAAGMQAIYECLARADTTWQSGTIGTSHEAAGAGVVDHVSFAIMRRLGISDVFTSDRHFKAAGFTTPF